MSLTKENYIQNEVLLNELEKKYALNDTDIKILRYVFTSQSGLATSVIVDNKQYYSINYSRMVSRMKIYDGYTCLNTTLHDKIKKKHINKLVELNLIEYHNYKGKLTTSTGKMISGTFPHMRIVDEIFNELKIIRFIRDFKDDFTEHIINNKNTNIRNKNADANVFDTLYSRNDKIIKAQKKIIKDQHKHISILENKISVLEEKINEISNNTTHVLVSNNTTSNNTTSNNITLEYKEENKRECSFPDLSPFVWGVLYDRWDAPIDMFEPHIEYQIREFCSQYSLEVVEAYCNYLIKKDCRIKGGTRFIQSGLHKQNEYMIKRKQSKKQQSKKNEKRKEEALGRNKPIHMPNADKTVTPTIVKILTKKFNTSKPIEDQVLYECPECKNNILGKYDTCSRCGAHLDYSTINYSKHMEG